MLIRVLLPAYMIVILLFAKNATAQELWAGASAVDITPPLGTLINGGFESEYASTVHDQLHAKAIVLRSGKKTIAIVVVDICEMLKDFLDETKQKIHKATGILPANVMISSTHAHSAGSVESDFLAAADLPYRSKLPGLITDAVVLAKKHLQKAEISFGYVSAPEHVRIRRYIMRPDYNAINPVTGQLDLIKTNPGRSSVGQIVSVAAEPDPELSFIGIRSVRKKWITILGNYSMHYVGDWPGGTLTADYFGVFSRHLKTKLGADENFVGILSNGTSGDANIQISTGENIYPEGNFAKSELIGTDLAQKTVQALQNVKWKRDISINSAYKEIAVRVRKPTKEELDTALLLVKQIDFKNIGEEKEDLYMRKLYAFEQTMLAQYPDTLQLPVHALRIGDAIIGGLPGEIFSETGIWLKKNKPSTYYFTIGLANGYVGYIPPAHEIKRGGYETWRCRTSCLEENAEAILRIELKKLADGLYSGRRVNN